MKQAERYLGEGLHPRVIVEVTSLSDDAVTMERSMHTLLRLTCTL